MITISGERQTGKTELAIDAMVRHAKEGLKVAYVGQALTCSANTQRRILDRDDSTVTKAYRHNGNMLIKYASGGSIRFLSAGKDSLRGLCLDILVWDDVQKAIPEDAYPALCASSQGLIYRIVAE